MIKQGLPRVAYHYQTTHSTHFIQHLQRAELCAGHGGGHKGKGVLTLLKKGLGVSVGNADG